MASSSRQADPSVVDTLLQKPFRFNFFQAVRVLLNAARGTGVEGSLPAHEDPVRFDSYVGFDFRPSDLVEAREERINGAGDTRFGLTLAMLGLAGHDGPLPDHYTELLLDRVRAHDFALKDFLDIFNHRIAQLFWETWAKHRFYVGVELGRGDYVSHAINALLGMGHQAQEGLDDGFETLAVFFAGALMRRPLPAHAVEAIVSAYFGRIPVEVIQFEGRWITLEEDSRFVLGVPNTGCVLGSFCPLGERVWDVSGQIRVKIGPVSYEEFLEFRPGCEKAVVLSRLLNTLTGGEIDFTTEVVLAPGENIGWRLGAVSGAFRLGTSLWLGSVQGEEPVVIKFDPKSGTSRPPGVNT